MNGRQAYALDHPITDPETATTDAYRSVDGQPDGNLLMSILAVDR